MSTKITTTFDSTPVVGGERVTPKVTAHKRAKAVTSGDVILVNGEWVTVDSVERTLGNAGEVAITHSGRWTIYARPNASIPTRSETV